MVYLYLMRKGQPPTQELMRAVLDGYRRKLGGEVKMLGGQKVDGPFPTEPDTYVVTTCLLLSKENSIPFDSNRDRIAYSVDSWGGEGVGVCQISVGQQEVARPEPSAVPAEEPSAPVGPPLGEFDRLTGVLFDPKATFPDVVARGRWWVPLLLLALLGVGFTFAYTQRVGWQRFMREQIEASPRTQQLSAEQKERIIEQQARLAPIFGYVGSILFPVILALILAGVFLFVFNVLVGNEISFAAAFAVISYAALPYLLRSVVAFALLFLKDPADFDLQNPVASNLGALLPADWPQWLTSTAVSVDLFNIWVLLLLATGFAAAARRMKWSKACAWVVALWVVWLMVKAGWVWIWS